MNNLKVLVFVVISIFLAACEKVVDIEIPNSEAQLVVEGRIESGVPPIVLLSKTVNYYAATDLETYQNSFVKGAKVIVSDGISTVQLTELNINGYTVYSTANTAIFGQEGKSYSLEIQAEGKTLTANTDIPQPIKMNRYWYKDQPGFSNYGYLWFNQTDPVETGNAYRMFTQRLGKDDRFLPCDGSVWDDQLINGLTFDAFVFRGQEPNSNDPEDVAETSEYYQQGDTIIIKFCTIDLPHFDFWETFETAAFNNGNPFAAPTTIRSNIQGGGIGVWGGYGVSYDTLIAVD